MAEDENYRYKFPFQRPGESDRPSEAQRERVTPLAPYTPERKPIDEREWVYPRRGPARRLHGPRRTYRT